MFDAAIIGAGLAGAVMACVLAQHGWDVVLLDRNVFPKHKVCGEFLSPESRQMLASLGLYSLVESLHPIEIKQVRLTAASGVSLELPLPGTALGVSRFLLDDQLQQAAAVKGVKVLAGTPVLEMVPEQDGQGYRLDIQEKGERRSLRARTVIGAWGRNPQAGVQAHANRPRTEPHPQDAWIGVKAHFAAAGPERENRIDMYFFPGGYVGVSPVEGGRLNVAALLSRRAFQAAGGSVPGAIAAAQQWQPALRSRLTACSLLSETQAAVSPVRLTRQPAAWGDIAHIGDAAAVIPPLCGDGMAMALRTVELCAPWVNRYLKKTVTLNEWRRHYTEAVRQEFAGPLRWGSWVQLASANAGAMSLLLRLGRFAPQLAYRVVQATRLKPI
ncbi:NAD(P)/FAD-dependent oxidoreductase [Paenibacillus koleovorans]|uniref:NAD(P)/FAD-dependent oxidoreductase n=1 Tax=Paenibacillus koleovorans TaxID=121608 RepID=UPI001FE627F8|nr:NAD(P)/FAD-dependent oxidoreductase [Paenibacillus koleovorans]